jgi:hypothetical protein
VLRKYHYEAVIPLAERRPKECSLLRSTSKSSSLLRIHLSRSRRDRSRRWRPAVVATASAVLVGSLLASGFFALAPRTDAIALSVFSSATVPTTLADPETNSVELGVRFSASRQITITGIKFFGTPQNRGPHTGTIWAEDGSRLRVVSFPRTSHQGWVTATLKRPLTVAAGTRLVASYRAPHGRYAVEEQGFTSSRTDGVVTFPAAAGVYSYGRGLPTDVYRDSNYYVDIQYSTKTSSDQPGTTGSPTPSAAPEPSSSPTPTPTSTPTTAPNPVAGSSGDSILALPRVGWYGGPSYYSKFANATASGWTNQSFFPISVFLGKPEQAASLKAIGINTYMAAEHDGSKVSTITDQGVSLIAQDEWSSAEVGDDPGVVGWFASDECDMGLGGCSAADEAGRLAQNAQYAAAFRAKNDGRFVQANFGNGVVGTWWAPNTMGAQVGLMDVSSVDKYAYTSPSADYVIAQSPYWPRGKDPVGASTYGWLQDRMAGFSKSTKPNWVFVETAMPFLTDDGARTITGDQIEGAVWNSIIHGASGIAYFQDNNNGCGIYSLVQCGPTIRNKVAQIDADVESVAPVINTQSYVWNFGPHLETALKAQGGSAYIFAMTDGTTGTRTFTLPAGLGGSVTVVGENRSIAISGGTFTDDFAAESTHHIYRIALG